MPCYQLKIVGVHYAVNPESTTSAEETQLMHQRTARRLSELDERRPPVVLIPDPTNPVDARAVMARVEGQRIGYVDKTQLDTVHALLHANGGRPLKARIESVEARKHGWMNICLETEEEVRIESRNERDGVWTEWTCHLPVLPVTETRYARMEAEAMIDDALKQGNAARVMDDLETYIRLWLRCALHDLSNEARLMREHYIGTLEERMAQCEAQAHRIAPLVESLKKQRTAICGNKRMHLRTGVWWKQLRTSKEMQLLWDSWEARIEGNMEQGLAEIDACLRTLPFDLYGLMNHKGLFFSRLHYNEVPRKAFYEIVSAMLLREQSLCTDRSKGTDTEGTDTEEDTFCIVIPPELQTPEAKKVIARLQKKGILDEDLQPVNLSITQKAVLAWELTERLRINKRWVVPAALWKCNPETLRKSWDKGYDKKVFKEFVKFIKPIIHY